MKKSLTFYLLAVLMVGLLSVSRARADNLDLIGDTFGVGPTQHDITSTNAVFNDSFLTFTVNLAGQVSPASAGLDRSVFGYIDIDTDRDAATGADSWINVISGVPGPAVGLGAEYYIDLFSEEFTPGQVDIFNDLDEFIGSVHINYNASSFSVAVPLSLLGGSNGLVNYAVLIGTLDEATDRAPNGSVPLTSTPVPEPATMLLLGTGLAGIGARLRRRRSAAPEA